MTMNETFSHRLKRIIEEKQLSCYKIAKLSNVSKGTISNYINGKISHPDTMILCKICVILEVSPHWILYGSGMQTLCESDIKYLRHKKTPTMSRIEIERTRNSLNRVINELILMREQNRVLEEFFNDIRAKVTK